MRSRNVFLAATVALVWTCGCSRDAFPCSEDAHCQQDGVAGVCQPQGWCSFPDDTCESGQRFGAHAGAGLANTCVSPDDAVGTTGDHGATEGDEPMPTTGGETAAETDAESTSSSSSGAATTDSSCPDWWDCAWSSRRAIEVGVVPAGDDDLIDVPVMVRLTPDRIDYDATEPGGADLRFVADDHASVLAHEIERWQPGDTSIVWVKLPNPSTGDRFFVYHGSPGASSNEQPTEVWSNGYVAVWHLDEPEDALGEFPLESVGTQVVEGRVGAGRLFDGSSTRMVVSADPIPALFSDGASISVWIHTHGWGGSDFGRIIESCSGSSTQGGWSFSVADPVESPSTVRFAHDFQNHRGEWRTDHDSIGLDQWHWISVGYEVSLSSLPTFTIDGAPAGFDEYHAPSGAPLQTSTAPTTLGAQATAELRHFDGIIDELRISTVIRSGAWLELQYRSMTDALLAYGEEEDAPGSP